MNRAAETAIAWTEAGLVPDAVIRAGIRRLNNRRLVEIHAEDVARAGDAMESLLARMDRSDIAPVPQYANLQHYELPAAFFSVSLSAYGNPAQAAAYIEEFCADTGWQPAGVITIAGALRYTSYGLVKRQVMKQVARDKGLSTDTGTDAVYTDWNAVTRFTEQFVTEAVSART